MKENLIYNLMQKAYEEALIAYREDEIPVASLIYHNGSILAKSHNRTRQLGDPLMHSESMVISLVLHNYPQSVLRESVLITTLEPCIMCTGQIILAKIKEVHFGAMAPKTGAVVSLYNLLDDRRLNHRPVYSHGWMEKEIGGLLSLFFQKKREIMKTCHSGSKLSEYGHSF